MAGLGNPGPEYAGNRHNAGFMVVERLAARNHMGAFRRKFSGRMLKGTIQDTDVVLLEPQTYMNLSGRSVRRTAAFYGIEPARTVVVHDDLDLLYGAVRVKDGGGAGGHKGLKSIHVCLGTDGYLRVRVGIGRPAVGSAEDYVLRDFTPDERIDLDGILGVAADAVTCVIEHGADVAMNEFNGRC